MLRAQPQRYLIESTMVSRCRLVPVIPENAGTAARLLVRYRAVLTGTGGNMGASLDRYHGSMTAMPEYSWASGSHDVRETHACRDVLGRSRYQLRSAHLKMVTNFRRTWHEIVATASCCTGHSTHASFSDACWSLPLCNGPLLWVICNRYESEKKGNRLMQDAAMA